MYEVDFFALLTMIIVNSFCAMFLYRKLQGIKKVYFLLSVISIFIYSGFGVSFFARDFLAQYIIFSTVYIFTLFIVMKDKKKECHPSRNRL